MLDLNSSRAKNDIEVDNQSFKFVYKVMAIDWREFARDMFSVWVIF